MTDDHSITNLNNAATEFHRAQRDLHRVALLNELRATGDAGVTSTELAHRIGLRFTTATRELHALLHEGRIERNTDGLYQLAAGFDHDNADSADITDENPETEISFTATGTDVDEDSGRSTDRPEWPRWANTALNQLDAGGRRVVRFVNADPEGAARLVFSTIGAVAFGLLGIVTLLRILNWAIDGNPLQDLAGILPAYELVTGPLQQWLTTHTAGTGIDVETAAWTWGITGAVIWFSACCNQLGAQLVAWPAFGTATVAMAWFGTTTAAHRPVAAGLVAIAWFVLSLFALNRRPKPRYRYTFDRAAATNEKTATA